MQISLSHNWRSYCKIPSADNAIIWNQKLLFKAPCKIVIKVKIFRFEITLVILFWRREHSNNDPNSKPSIFKRQSGAREIGSWATNECNLMLRLLQTSSGEFFEKITPHSSNKQTYSFIKIPNCFAKVVALHTFFFKWSENCTWESSRNSGHHWRCCSGSLLVVN